MALHYSNTHSNNNHGDSEPKVAVTRNYSNPIPVQKTPFSIEDILYQRNNAASASSAPVKSCQPSGPVNGHAKGSNGNHIPQMTNPRSEFTQVGDDKKSHQSDRFQMNKASHGSSFNTAGAATGPPNGAAVQPPPTTGNPYSNSSANNMHSLYPTGPTYSDGYLHMIAPYLASTATGYKSVDPYFLSQGENVPHNLTILVLRRVCQ